MTRLESGTYHIPVMLRECMEWLRPHADGTYVDATLGGGGHTAEILKSGARVISFDADDEALRHCQKRFEGTSVAVIEHTSSYAEQHVPPTRVASIDPTTQLTLVHANFSTMSDVLGSMRVDGILFDLGVSSFQFDHHDRGFSYRKQAPLDMRFTAEGQTAADILNTGTSDDIVAILREYGEEPMARRLTDAILQRRSLAPIRTVADLRDIVIQTIPPQHQPKTMARVFQALRIATNRELDRLEHVLAHAAPLLKPDGRIVVMSYHSLEDRIVKTAFKALADQHLVSVLTKKPIEPDREEIARNPRSRSARLRVCERIFAA